MPKFYKSKEGDPVRYKARATGLLRRSLLRMLPYFTGGSISIEMWIANPDGRWRELTFRVDPPVIDYVPLDEQMTPFRISDSTARVPQGDWVCVPLSISHRELTRNAANLTCTAVLVEADRSQGRVTSEIQVAEIPVKDGHDYGRWTFTTILALAATAMGIAALLIAIAQS